MSTCNWVTVVYLPRSCTHVNQSIVPGHSPVIFVHTEYYTSSEHEPYYLYVPGEMKKKYILIILSAFVTFYLILYSNLESATSKSLHIHQSVCKILPLIIFFITVTIVTYIVAHNMQVFQYYQGS